MAELVFGLDKEIAEWAALRIPHVGAAGFDKAATAIGVASGNRLLAGVVYHDYQPQFGTIQLSMAADSPMWARRDVIAGLLHYPFMQLGCFKAWLAAPHDGGHGLKTWAHIGFKREAILAHQFGRKRHAVIMRLLQPDYLRLYGNKVHGQKVV